MNGQRDYLLIRSKSAVVAAAVPRSNGDEGPEFFEYEGQIYRAIEDEETVFFWNELCDSDGRTVGYVFFAPKSPTFAMSRFVRESENVSIEESSNIVEVTIMLTPCNEPQWVSLEAFGSSIYAGSDDTRDCAVFLFDYSENEIGFPLMSCETMDS